MGDKERLVLYVSEETADAFRDQVASMYGKVDGNQSQAGETAIREWLDKDRAARIESKLDDVLARLDETPDERERDSAVSSAGGKRVQKRHNSIANDLPEKTWVSEDVVTRCIAEHAGDSADTLRKYKRRLKQYGDLIELPEGVGDPDGDRFATSPEVWAIRAENDRDIRPTHINHVIGDLEPALGEGWYLDALPDEFIRHRDLCYDQIPGLSSLDYQEDHGLVNGNHPEREVTND